VDRTYRSNPTAATLMQRWLKEEIAAARSRFARSKGTDRAAAQRLHTAACAAYWFAKLARPTGPTERIDET